MNAGQTEGLLRSIATLLDIDIAIPDHTTLSRRNVTANRSPKADFSPKLESRPFYSTSFFASGFSVVASFASRKVGTPFRLLDPRSQQTNRSH